MYTLFGCTPARLEITTTTTTTLLLWNVQWLVCRLSRQSVVLAKFHWKTLTSWTRWKNGWRNSKQNRIWTLMPREQSPSWKMLWTKLVHIRPMMIQNSEHYERVMLLGNRIMNFLTQLSFSCQSWLEWVCRFNGVFLSFVLKVLSGIFMVCNYYYYYYFQFQFPMTIQNSQPIFGGCSR